MENQRYRNGQFWATLRCDEWFRRRNATEGKGCQRQLVRLIDDVQRFVPVIPKVFRKVCVGERTSGGHLQVYPQKKSEEVVMCQKQNLNILFSLFAVVPKCLHSASFLNVLRTPPFPWGLGHTWE